MEEDRLPLKRNSRTESAQFVKTLLERRHHPVEEQVEDSKMTSNNWVASKDFTVEVGLKQIEEYIQTWELQPSWLHSLVFLSCSEEEEEEEEEGLRTFYHYRARFSTPTRRNPIQGSASVYFVARVSKVEPRTRPVEVRFVVESTRLVHAPGRTRFREKWLADVVESKALLRGEVDL